MNTQHFEQHLNRYLSKLIIKIKNKSSLQVLVHSEKLGMSFNYPSNAPEKPYHIASIGKVFTATLIFMLIERGMLSLGDQIVRYIPRDLLKNLFTYQGIDYADQVTIKNLMAHTSGVNDYFEGKVIKGTLFMKDIIDNPDTFWTPNMLLNYSKDNQKAVGKPGVKFYYSDTGYILLGKIIENVTRKPFDVNLNDEFFIPYKMNDTYLMYYSEPVNQPKRPIQKIWLNGIEVSTFKSLSCDWAGGGIISTTSDLLKFHMALRKGKLIGDATLKNMEICNNKFRTGIYYGTGMMEIHFEDFFFLLRGLPRVTGHIGILSTHMFYDKTTETYINMNFGSTSFMTTSFKTLIEIMNNIKRIK
jgi:D-alanyl-D-alanine carboxypeptidase